MILLISGARDEAFANGTTRTFEKPLALPYVPTLQPGELQRWLRLTYRQKYKVNKLKRQSLVLLSRPISTISS